MQPNEMNNLFHLIYSNLKTYCELYPFDTGNMHSHILVSETEDYWEITISAPKKSGDYSRVVNEASLAAAQNRPMSRAEAENYHWIEKALTRAIEVFNGNNSGGALINDV